MHNLTISRKFMCMPIIYDSFVLPKPNMISILFLNRRIVTCFITSYEHLILPYEYSTKVEYDKY